MVLPLFLFVWSQDMVRLSALPDVVDAFGVCGKARCLYPRVLRSNDSRQRGETMW